MKTITRKLFTVLMLGFALTLTACGPSFETALESVLEPSNAQNDDGSYGLEDPELDEKVDDLLGAKSATDTGTSNTGTSSAGSSVTSATDEEIIAATIKLLKLQIETLKSRDQTKFDVSKIIAQLEERIRKLETDPEFAASIVKQIRNPKGYTPERRAGLCEFLKKTANNEAAPAALKERAKIILARDCK